MGEEKFITTEEENLLELELFLIECYENGGLSIRGECVNAENNIDYIFDMEYNIYNRNNKDIILKIYNDTQVFYVEIKNYIKNIKNTENGLIINSVIGKIELESI